MFVDQRSFPGCHQVRASRSGAFGAMCVGVFGAALLAAGCSANITRFDQPSFALNDSGSSTVTAVGGRRNSSGPSYDEIVSAPPSTPAAPVGANVPPLPASYQPAAPAGATAASQEASKKQGSHRGKSGENSGYQIMLHGSRPLGPPGHPRPGSLPIIN